MVNYLCPRCGYETTQRNDMRKHQQRKRWCRNKLRDINISGLNLDDFDKTKSINFEKVSKSVKKCQIRQNS